MRGTSSHSNMWPIFLSHARFTGGRGSRHRLRRIVVTRPTDARLKMVKVMRGLL